ncbi:uncharacterized protein LOC107636015 [Arachis ipaensis]|uniref:uncharacterized protein LOC107636015 n=1 Tax=Arachis ipaensis TaxID=130454 RepID=UPI0007AEEAF0|nr:uncharacterized protein LOC107636015 [Arachis ipaensis]
MRLLMSSSDQHDGKINRFANWILDVGNENIGFTVGDESEVNIPDDLLITTVDDPLSHLIDFAYPDLLDGKGISKFLHNMQANENEDVQQEWFIPEFLNKIRSLGLPNHKLTLKPGAIVMLLQNIDQTSGLCNGTRLIVNELDNNVIGVTSQDQSLCHVGLCLPKSVFTHGQLYVALSRVKSRSCFKVLILDEDGNPKLLTTNVMFKEVFNNI